MAAAVAGGTTAAVLLSTGGGGNGGTGDQAASGSYTSPDAVTFTSPWRLKISNSGYTGNGPADGCSLWLIDAKSGKVRWHVADGLYGTSTFQVKYTGTFRWRVNDQKCQVVSLTGTDSRTLPFDYTQTEVGDTPAFAVPGATVTVQVTDWSGNVSCDFWLHDPANGQLLDFKTATKTPTGNPITLQTEGHTHAYLEWNDCGTVHLSAGPLAA